MKPGTTKVAVPQQRRTCGMDLFEAIRGRRAVRSYTDRRVEPALVQELLDAAVQAPSAINLQPWAFVVIQDADLLRRISTRAKQLTLAQLQPGTPLAEHRDVLEDPAFNVFYDGGTVIVVIATPGPWPSNEDCCLAAQNLMLAAHGLGLGTCPIGFAREAMNEPATKAELGIPADHSVVMPVLVGYPRERPAPPPRRAAVVLAWK